MENEHQVCSIEHAKKLKELGVHQISVWFWEKMKEPVMEGLCTKRLQAHFNTGHPISQGVVEDTFSAFTVAELGVMLSYENFNPSSMEHDQHASNGKQMVGIWRYNDDWFIRNSYGDYPGRFLLEAHARASRLLFLLENKLVTVEEVNARLIAL